jgi:DNA topoisomerase-1
VEGGPKPQYAKMKQDQSIETITLEEALDLFKLPRKMGLFEDSEVVASAGRFGPYVLHNKLFISIPKEYDVFEITLPECIEIINKKREAIANAHIKSFEKEGIEILIGRYGPYMKKEKENYKIPKDKVAADLTLEECLEIIKEQDANPKVGKGRFAKRGAAKKATEVAKPSAKKATTKKAPAKKASAKKASAKKATAKKKTATKK